MSCGNRPISPTSTRRLVAGSDSAAGSAGAGSAGACSAGVGSVGPVVGAGCGSAAGSADGVSGGLISVAPSTDAALTAVAARSAAAFISDAGGEAAVTGGSAGPWDPLHATKKNIAKNRKRVIFRAISNVNVQVSRQTSVNQPTEQGGS